VDECKPLIPGTDIAIPGGSMGVVGVLTGGGIVFGVLLAVLVRSCLRQRLTLVHFSAQRKRLLVG
jgi:hypothetical protein